MADTVGANFQSNDKKSNFLKKRCKSYQYAGGFAFRLVYLFVPS